MREGTENRTSADADAPPGVSLFSGEGECVYGGFQTGTLPERAGIYYGIFLKIIADERFGTRQGNE
jgi:hypothetical protein